MGFEGYKIENRPKLPGGSYVGRPYEKDNQWFNGLGEKISRDQAYAFEYWREQKQKFGDQFVENMKKTFEINIEESARNIDPDTGEGLFGIFSGKQFSEAEKGKVSAYREIAKKLGYEI